MYMSSQVCMPSPIVAHGEDMTSSSFHFPSSVPLPRDQCMLIDGGSVLFVLLDCFKEETGIYLLHRRCGAPKLLKGIRKKLEDCCSASAEHEQQPCKSGGYDVPITYRKKEQRVAS